MTINRKFLALCRTIHIYLTMLGLFVMLGFGFTGFTAYHEDWFGATQPHVTDFHGQVPTEIIVRKDSLGIVENVRQAFAIHGAMTGFDELEDKYAIAFKAPGVAWETEVDKLSGMTAVHKHSFNWMAVLNDLHRGRDAGRHWGWVIDISAFLIVLACLTGVVLWLVLPKRRKLGILALAAGVGGTLAVFSMLVPGSDAPIQTKLKAFSP